ncbi:MAG: hypothetical protein LVR00_02195 [Rhabdochlamydiaceae bacterium]
MKGNKVRITCTFRGREMMHTEFGERLYAACVMTSLILQPLKRH